MCLQLKVLSMWVIRLEVITPGFVWGKGGRGEVCYSVCEAPLDDWANGGSDDVFFRYG